MCTNRKKESVTTQLTIMPTSQFIIYNPNYPNEEIKVEER